MTTTLYTLPSLPCTLPCAAIADDVDLDTIATQTEKALSNLGQDDLLPDAIWRDTFALTGTLRTFYSAAGVQEAWSATFQTHQPCGFSTGPAPLRVIRSLNSAWVEVPFTFETTEIPATTCSGFASMTQAEDGQWKIWLLRTILEGLQGHPSPDYLQPVADAGPQNDNRELSNGSNGNISTAIANGAYHANGTSATRIHNNGSVKPTHYGCVVVGGGQAGLSTGGRLQALGVSYVILEKHANVGDNWKTRYDSTKLHTIREFGHLPFDRTFPKVYPEFLTKNQLAEGYQNWTNKFGINIMLSTSLAAGSWDATTETWTLEIVTGGEQSTITCSSVVFAVGVGSQVPLKPTYKDESVFKGTTFHSSDYKNAKPWRAKHGVVVGTANTAHDVADDMLEAGLASVTMVQRTPTYVVPAEHYSSTQTRLYNDLVPTELADRMYFSGPAVLGRLMSTTTLRGLAAQEPERFEALERAGFQLDKQGDMFYYLFQRFGGHYMDVGTSAKISKRLIKVKSDSLPVAWTEHGLICSDGSRLPADVVVFATGFVCNLKLQVSELFGPEVAASLDELWGLDEEGELRGAFKPCGHPAFWYHGGAVGQARYYSRFIALQAKARLLGTPLPLYEGTRRTTKLAVS